MSRNHWKMTLGTALLSLCAGAASSAAFGQAPDGPPPGPPPGSSQDQQGPGQRGPNPERELQTLTRLLTLTADQQTGVKAVLEQQSEQMKALRNKSQNEASNTRETMQARRSQVEAIRNESNTRIAALLDENQKKTFADWTAKRKAEMEKRRSQGGGDGPPPPPPPDGGGSPNGE